MSLQHLIGKIEKLTIDDIKYDGNLLLKGLFLPLHLLFVFLDRAERHYKKLNKAKTQAIQKWSLQDLPLQTVADGSVITDHSYNSYADHTGPTEYRSASKSMPRNDWYADEPVHPVDDSKHHI